MGTAEGMRAYSMDLRERVVAAVDRGMTQEQAAVTFGVSVNTVGRYLARRRDTGSLAPTAYRHGPRPEKKARLQRPVDDVRRSVTPAVTRRRQCEGEHRSPWSHGPSGELREGADQGYTTRVIRALVALASTATGTATPRLEAAVGGHARS